MEIKLKPFQSPNDVVEDVTGLKFEPRIYSLDMLEARTLSDLCDQFRKDIFQKAGKSDPRIQGNIRGAVKASDETYYGL